MRLRPTLPTAPRTLRLLAIAATAAGAGLWSAILLAPEPAALPPALATAATPASDTQAMAMLFGSDGVIDTQIAVLGLIAAGAQGSAVLSVDGGPPRAYRVGAEIAPGLALAGVSPAGVELDRNGARVRAAAPARAAPPAGFVPAR
ncbi:general secretion pathway protein GspC [Bordetella sp. BOR01]|uniref:type II secretion system protein N n=1 Tax=Bordetella sp. BOR01 TaxID=2854779 RepID=UPI001C43A609|nr:general secretion pathway protein GspC [Bordetella sp. BOR01]MBV7482803.1 general secretion pathway protein GspC [Bordetella sp. BOR01]